jgi:ABC-type glycerol-3-phosphate transport system permease component
MARVNAAPSASARTAEVDVAPRVRSARARASLTRLAVPLVVSIPFLYPLLYLASLAVKSKGNYIADPSGLLPTEWTTANLARSWGDGQLGGAMAHSFVAVSIGVVVLVAVSVPAAFWVHSNRSGQARLVKAFLVGMMSFPLIAMVIPLFLVLNALNLVNQLWVLGLVYGAINAPFGIYLVQAYFRTGLADAIVEAARLDGAGLLRVLWSVVLPLSRPVVATLSALAFIWTWGDLLLAVVLLQDPSQQTAMIAISNLAQHREGVDVQLNSAAALISLVPVLLVFALAQRSIIRGFAGGAVK